MEKLYIVVRSDLPAGLQIAQACHALREFTNDYKVKDHEWFYNHKTIVVLSEQNKRKLENLFITLKNKGFSTSRFTEPDLGNELTAIAVEGEAKSILKRLPLALKD